MLEKEIEVHEEDEDYVEGGEEIKDREVQEEYKDEVEEKKEEKEVHNEE